jgi:hypothetical protein
VNITIRRVAFGFMIRVRAGVPEVFIRTPDTGHAREGVIRYIELLWECAQP